MKTKTQRINDLEDELRRYVSAYEYALKKLGPRTFEGSELAHLVRKPVKRQSISQSTDVAGTTMSLDELALRYGSQITMPVPTPSRPIRLFNPETDHGYDIGLDITYIGVE